MFSLYSAFGNFKPSDEIEVLRSDSKEKIQNWVMENKKGARAISDFSWTLDKPYGRFYFWIDNSPDILVI